MNVLGVVPARGGSKGIPDKNLKELSGRPLLAYVAQAAKSSGVIDRLILTTDSQKIADLGTSLGLEVPFLRPSELAQDDTPMISVAQHAVEEIEATGWKPDVVVLLQPTSPLRKSQSITSAIQLIVDKKADSVVSVVEIPDLFSPQKAMKIEAGYLRFWSQAGQSITRRQQVETTYAREGTIYACTRDLLMEKRTLYGEKCLPLIVSSDEALSLDTMADWERAEELFTQGAQK